MHGFRRGRWLTLLLGALGPGLAAAAEPDVFDSARHSARATAEWLARGVDSWFGGKPFDEGGEVRDGRLSLALLKPAHEKAELNLRFNARFRLPNLQESAYVYIGRDNPQELVQDQPGALTRRQRGLRDDDKDDAFFAGLGLALREAVDLRVGVRGGIKPYLQARYRAPWQVGERGRMEFRQTLFWTVDDHIGSTTALAYERSLSPRLALRWLTAATVTQESRRLDWTSSVATFRDFGAQRLLTLEAIVAGAQHTGVALTEYGLQTRWEQPLGRDWLVGEVSVGHFWRREQASVPRDGAWAAGAALKIAF